MEVNGRTRSVRRNRELVACLLFVHADGPVQLPAIGRVTVKVSPLAREPKGADGLADVLDNLSRGGGCVAEVALTACTAGSGEGVAACGTGEGASGKVRSEGGSERSPARERSYGLGGGRDGELGPVKAGLLTG